MALHSLYTFYWLHSNWRERLRPSLQQCNWLGLLSYKNVIYKTHRKNSLKYKRHIQIPHDHNFLLCLQNLFMSLCLNTLYPFGENPSTLWTYISVQAWQSLMISAFLGWNVACSSAVRVAITNCPYRDHRDHNPSPPRNFDPRKSIGNS